MHSKWKNILSYFNRSSKASHIHKNFCFSWEAQVRITHLLPQVPSSLLSGPLRKQSTSDVSPSSPTCGPLEFSCMKLSPMGRFPIQVLLMFPLRRCMWHKHQLVEGNFKKPPLSKVKEWTLPTRTWFALPSVEILLQYAQLLCRHLFYWVHSSPSLIHSATSGPQGRECAWSCCGCRDEAGATHRCSPKGRPRARGRRGGNQGFRCLLLSVGPEGLVQALWNLSLLRK